MVLQDGVDLGKIDCQVFVDEEMAKTSHWSHLLCMMAK
jgi:hypothetical protein